MADQFGMQRYSGSNMVYTEKWDTNVSNDQGTVHSGDEAVGSLFVDYFTNLFQTSTPTEFSAVLHGIGPVITTEMNSQLTRPFMRQEVDNAIKQMGPLKALGTDSMSPIFYQTFWDSIGTDVSSAVLSCLNSGSILKSINHTYITLIPKKQNPTKVTDFLPISLCNVIYKILSKILTIRLKTILPKIISETQSAFVPGRLITDNILVAFETLHHMKTRHTSHITSERHYFPENAKVANLIDQVSNTWKLPLIQHLFTPIEAQKILGLPLSTHATPDKLYWPHTASEEDVLHALWGCQVAVNLWAKNTSFQSLQGSSFTSFTYLLAWVSNTMDEQLHLDYLSHHARSLCSPAHSSPTRWIPPQVGTWKVNFDGAMFQASLTSGVGVVVRDHRGYALAALSQKFPIAHALVVIEARAARAAIQLALDLKLDRVSFEGDSTQVITALQCQDNNYTSYGHLIAETQNKTLSLQSFTFEHVGRSANSVAHADLAH
uniref:RNase H type-1 domain-containing protein n=1 Tax=Fagus sylvatica TaxID=28930 RepID=A0A2N9EG46_FAGSY